MTGHLTRNVTQEECPWLEADLSEGKEVHKFDGATYGCITDSGVAVSDTVDENPFYEIPIDSVLWE